MIHCKAMHRFTSRLLCGYEWIPRCEWIPRYEWIAGYEQKMNAGRAFFPVCSVWGKSAQVTTIVFRFVLNLGLFFALGFGTATSDVQAQQAPAKDLVGKTVSSPSESLSSSPWYDPSKGSIVPVDIDPRVDDSVNRDSRWLPQAQRVRKPPTPPSAGGGGTGGLFGTDLTLGNLFGWVLLALLFAGGIGLLIFALNQTELDGQRSATRRGESRNNDQPDQATIERMKHLPVELRRTDVNLRSEALRLMQAGTFDQAIILLYGHQLIQLDRAGHLRLNRGKTNRSYVREVRGMQAVNADQLEMTVAAFERSYFGRHQLSRDDFETLWANNLELEDSLSIQRGAAA